MYHFRRIFWFGLTCQGFSKVYCESFLKEHSSKNHNCEIHINEGTSVCLFFRIILLMSFQHGFYPACTIQKIQLSEPGVKNYKNIRAILRKLYKTTIAFLFPCDFHLKKFVKHIAKMQWFNFENSKRKFDSESHDTFTTFLIFA